MAGERSDELLRISNVNKGVTVLELLLTIALSAIILSAIYGVFISGLKIWEIENPKSLVQQEARLQVGLQTAKTAPRSTLTARMIMLTAVMAPL